MERIAKTVAQYHNEDVATIVCGEIGKKIERCETKRLVLIDGSSLLSTNFYGTLDRRYHMEKTEEGKQAYLDKLLSLSTGEKINGVYAMTKAIERMIERVNPTHMAIAWDVSRQTFRREMYSEYKAHRGKTVPELKTQFGLAQKFFDELGIAQFMFEEFEADDVIGTLSKKFEDEIMTSIWTKDQDAIQLISENTSLWLITSKAKDMYTEAGIKPEECAIPVGVFEHTPYTIKQHYGIRPLQIIDLKAIEGDTSDNIPGVAGVGVKTAKPLIQEFGGVSEIFEFLEGGKAKDIKAFFKGIGISSPLNKMMEEIKPHDVVSNLTKAIEDSANDLNEKSLAAIGYQDGPEGINAETLEEELGNVEEKELKKIYKTLKKEESLMDILNQVGEYKPGKAKEMALISKKLATIVRDIEALDQVDLSSLELNVSQAKKNEVFGRYEFNSLIKRS